MGINVFQVDAFSDKPFGGNAAGVIPDAKGMEEEKMQTVAREMNISETAFIEKLDEDYFNVRFFTPKKEVEMCGHATIGAFFILAKKRYITPIENGVKTVHQYTRVGKLPVYISYVDGEVNKVAMEQAPPEEFGHVKDLGELAKSLGIDIEDIGIEGLEVLPKIVSTGLKDIILPVKSKQVLDGIKVDNEHLSRLSVENDVIGVHVFYMPDVDGDIVYTRNFAPRVNIDEESATGTANGALIYLLKNDGILKGNRMLAYQGKSMNRPSQIECVITEDNKVMVGGQARMSIDGILMISE